MYRPQFPVPRRRYARRWAAAAVVAAAVTLGTVSPGYAFLTDRTPALTNRFAPATSSTPGIRESFDGTVKSNVSVVNLGDCPGYIRCTVTVALLDDDGNVLPRVPRQGTDYTISYSSDWIRGSDGYFYCPDSINPGDSTPVLIRSCSALTPGTRLEVNVLAQSVQARPRRAVEDAWGVTVTDGTITK